MNIEKERFRLILLKLEHELLSTSAENAEAAKPVELDQSRVGRLSRMDALQNQAMSVQTHQRRKLQSQKIKAALIRIENDEFGQCIKCDLDISEKRLEIDPCATLCITCAEKMESRSP